MELTKRQKELKELSEKIEKLVDSYDAILVAKIQFSEDGIRPYPTFIDAPVKDQPKIKKENTKEK